MPRPSDMPCMFKCQLAAYVLSASLQVLRARESEHSKNQMAQLYTDSFSTHALKNEECADWLMLSAVVE